MSILSRTKRMHQSVKGKANAMAIVGLIAALGLSPQALQSQEGDHKLPRVLQFDGDSGRVKMDLEGVELDGALTFEMWVKVNTHDDNNRQWMVLKDSADSGINFIEAGTGWRDTLHGPSNLGSGKNRVYKKFDELLDLDQILACDYFLFRFLLTDSQAYVNSLRKDSI